VRGPAAEAPCKVDVSLADASLVVPVEVNRPWRSTLSLGSSSSVEVPHSRGSATLGSLQGPRHLMSNVAERPCRVSVIFVCELSPWPG
jgi:hypothetical protein